MKSASIVVSFAAGLVATLAVTADAPAQKKPKVVRACGHSLIPLTVGNTWTYEPTAHPDAANLKESATKLLPVQPQKVVIEVTAIEAAADGKGPTTIRLKETVDDRVVETVATCTATTLSFAPESFWFAGEPGHAVNLAFDQLARTGQGFPLAAATKTAGGAITGNEWHDDVKGRWTRNPAENSGAPGTQGGFDLKRRVVVAAIEPTATVMGSFPKASKVAIETTGEISLDNANGKPYVLPEGLVTWYWIVDGTGLVMVHNSFFQAYQLTAATIAK